MIFPVSKLLRALDRWAGDSELRAMVAWLVIVASLPLWVFGGEEP